MTSGTPASDREFDIVVYGATGFVGGLTAEYLARAGGGARIALAGPHTRQAPGGAGFARFRRADWPILTADASAQSSLDAMAPGRGWSSPRWAPTPDTDFPSWPRAPRRERTTPISPVRQCSSAKSIDEFHKQAIDTGARIVHACGFDSIPSDMSVFELYRRAAQDGTGSLMDTNFVLRGFSGGVSGGTVASMIEVFDASSSDPEIRALLDDPYTLTPDRVAEPELGAQPDLPWRRGRDIAPELAGTWTTGFAMALYNTRIVRRSNALLTMPTAADFGTRRTSVSARPGWRRSCRGRQRREQRRSRIGEPLLRAAAEAIGRARRTCSRNGSEQGGQGPRLLPGRDVHDDHRRSPLHGQHLAAGRSRLQGDIGHAGECGLAPLALDQDALSDLRGSAYPAAAMGDALLARFPNAGIQLESTRLD